MNAGRLAIATLEGMPRFTAETVGARLRFAPRLALFCKEGTMQNGTMSVRPDADFSKYSLNNVLSNLVLALLRVPSCLRGEIAISW